VKTFAIFLFEEKKKKKKKKALVRKIFVSKKREKLKKYVELGHQQYWEA